MVFKSSAPFEISRFSQVNQFKAYKLQFCAFYKQIVLSSLLPHKKHMIFILKRAEDFSYFHQLLF